MGGDSGALWYGEQDKAGVGLHFAGDVGGSVNEEHALACHLETVLERLEVSLTPTEPEEEPTVVPTVEPPETLIPEPVSGNGSRGRFAVPVTPNGAKREPQPDPLLEERRLLRDAIARLDQLIDRLSEVNGAEA